MTQDSVSYTRREIAGVAVATSRFPNAVDEIEDKSNYQLFIIRCTRTGFYFMAAVAMEQGISLDRIRQIKESGIRKLRRGKARRELLRKFDIAEKSLYRGGSKNYKEHDFTSVVEYIAIRKIEAEKRYKKHMEEIENMRITHQNAQIGAEIC